MEEIQIPGIGIPDSITNKTEKSKKYFLILDFSCGSIKIVESSHVDKRYHKEIQDLTEEEVDNLGLEIADNAYDENRDIHCDKCNKFYRPYCRKHPLFKIPDRVCVRDKTSPLTFAEQTLPILFSIEKSRLQNAGLGVIANVFIPVGMVFGPYKGRRVYKKSDYKEDGYAWEIKGNEKRMYIDGSDPQMSNWLRYINSPRYEDEQNILAFQTNGRVFYRVIKPIKVKEELLVWYGSSFGGEFLESEDGHKTRKSYKNPFIW